MVGWKLVGEKLHDIYTKCMQRPVRRLFKRRVTITINVYFPTPFVYLLMYSGKKLAVFNL